ncbi:N-acetylglucosamine-6-phosphate deacetylase [Sphingomonas sp. 37zxx]|uniref:N-acetylglucosamine-6-phosphate deacetylase n=1 Tax=Sphingomonas sp. 37zxx TaxID=1550073 RepID=UPI00053BDA4C|nr:N-acetylglucosamine-6-phosphate deacetylase [Sphingomonas sp. 37zxx]
MTKLRFTGGSIVVGEQLWAGAEIEVVDGRVAALTPLADGSTGGIDLAGGWLMPGFVDTQVNGGGGVLFNDETNVEGIRAIGAAHARYGTTAFLPTLISEGPDKIAAAMAASDAAIAAGVPGVVGVHIEGPMLNPIRKGIHDEARFRPFDEEMFALLTQPHRGTVMVTLAPECVSPDNIARLSQAGVRVSAGHSEATYEEALAAFDAGLVGITHLFNAMPAMRQRAPGLVGATLDDPRPWCGLIVDGVHVAPSVLRVALRARPLDRMMLVTDAMPSVGAVDKDFVLQGRQIHVQDGICIYADGTLAGADLDMAGAVARTIRDLGVQPQDAAAMASTNPAAFLCQSADRGSIAVGSFADLAMLDRDFAPVATWIGGTQVFGQA